MTIILLRHAQAGSRSSWRGDDLVRPLTRDGRRQAADLVDVLAEIPVESIRSSPYLRCMETVAPIAARLGLPVISDGSLAEGHTMAGLDVVRSLAGDTVVLCSHGDLIPNILNALATSDGIDLGRSPRCQKSSIWLLEPVGDAGRFGLATYIAPPSGR
jgi:broad specificity phosphatase PhoE